MNIETRTYEEVAKSPLHPEKTIYLDGHTVTQIYLHLTAKHNKPIFLGVLLDSVFLKLRHYDTVYLVTMQEQHSALIVVRDWLLQNMATLKTDFKSNIEIKVDTSIYDVSVMDLPESGFYLLPWRINRLFDYVSGKTMYSNAVEYIIEEIKYILQYKNVVTIYCYKESEPKLSACIPWLLKKVQETK